MSRTKNFYLLKILLLFTIYFVTAKFGLNLQAVSKFATLVWIPTGLSLAVLLLYGYTLWPAIFVGAFFVNLSTGAPPLVAGGIAIGNTLEALVGVYLLRKIFDFTLSMSKLKDVLSLLLITAPLIAFVSATLGVSSLFIGKVILTSQFIATWIPWWVGDVISCFIVTPFLLLWLQKVPFNKSPLRVIEFVGFAVVVIIVGLTTFQGFLGFSVSNYPKTYLVYPPMIWAALRFGQREVAGMMLFFSGLAIWGTMLGLGPFTTEDINTNLLSLQFFMIITSLTSLVLATVVSERKQLEKRKDDFISMASHELKTPVTSLKLYVEVVKKKIDEGKFTSAKKYMNRLEDQISKLTGLIVDLLDVSRIQSGKLLVTKKPFNINILIEETVESLQKITKSHTFFIKGKIKNDVVADKERIYQVLVNLLTNAIKYSPNGGKIVIHCRNMKHSIRISVEDNGIGIERSQLYRIFEKLYRVPEEGNQVFHGFGIGLFVSSEIIRMHKGKIWAESIKGKGSIFYFTLPSIKEKASRNYFKFHQI